MLPEVENLWHRLLFRPLTTRRFENA